MGTTTEIIVCSCAKFLIKILFLFAFFFPLMDPCNRCRQRIQTRNPKSFPGKRAPSNAPPWELKRRCSDCACAGSLSTCHDREPAHRTPLYLSAGATILRVNKKQFGCHEN